MVGARPSQGGPGGSRVSRLRKVSQRMAVVGEDERHNAVAARLDALEADREEEGNGVFAEHGSDEEYAASDDDGDPASPPGTKKGGRKGVRGRKPGAPPTIRRTTRGARERHQTQNFAALLEEAHLEELPPGEASYLTTLAGPPKTRAPRKLCSVCGALSTYTCVRCGSRYCCARCYSVHTETRCLKFVG